MATFPPILKEDSHEVFPAYVTTHYVKTGEIINYSSIPDTMAGTPLRIAKKRKSKKATSEAVEDEASEPKPKKQKKSKINPQINVDEPAFLTIQEEVSDLEPVKILQKGTRGGSSEIASSQLEPKAQKKRITIRKMEVSDYVLQEDAEVEDTTGLVTRMERNKKATTELEASLLDKAFAIASEIAMPAESLLKESTAEDVQKVVELAGGIQEMVKTGDLLKVAEESQKEKAACSEALSSEAVETRGNTSSHTISNDITELESTSTSHSSDTINDIPLSRVYKTLYKSLAPSPSSKSQKKLDDVFVPMYPSDVERIGNMAQMRIDVCQKLPANHPLQPPFIQPLQTIPADEQFGGEQAEPTSDNPETTSSSSHTQPSNQTREPSVFHALSDHYKGELPSYMSSSEKSSEIVPDIAVSESPQQHQPEQRPIYPIPNTRESSSPVKPVSDDNTSILEEQTHVVQPISVALPTISSEATTVPKPSHELTLEPSLTATSDSDVKNEHDVQAKLSLYSSSPFVLESILDPPYVAPNQSAITEIIHSDIPSSFNQILPQPITTHVSSPPTLLLDSVILKEVCENIFEDLSKLVKARNNFVHLEKWTALIERVDTVMCELQKLSLEAHKESINTLNN